jgi:hypothetical protein
MRNDLQGKYKVVSFQWGYIIASFDRLKDALTYVSDRGMRADHRRGDSNVYAAY